MRFLLVMLLPILLLSSCADPVQQEYERNVKLITAKKWKYDAESIREAAKSTLKTNQEEDLMNSALSRLENTAFVFNEDGSMLLERPDQPLQGTWELSKYSKEFFILLPGTSNLSNPVESIAADRLVLGTDPEKGIIFPKIFIPAE